MAKELPYFRFTLQEWQNGNITNMSDSAQGVFINVCVFYWARDCNITEEELMERFKTKTKTIQRLIKNNVIKRQNGIISISFLDQQLLELNENFQFFSECGKRGQKAKKNKAPLKPPLKPRLSYKDNIKENKDKNKYRDTVFLSKDELKKLEESHGKKNAQIFIDILDFYKGSKGKTYKSDYKAILSWVIDKAKKEQKYIPQRIKSKTVYDTGGKLGNMLPEVKNIAGELADKFKV